MVGKEAGLPLGMQDDMLKRRQSSTVRGVLRFCSHKPLAAAGAVVILLLIIVALIGPWLAPMRYDEFVAAERLQGPSWDHLFGTDGQGRDVLSRVLYGARITVLVGFGATAIATIAGTLFGLISGYAGGVVDTIAQRILEIWMAFPGLIFIIFIISIFQASNLTVILTIGALFTAGTSRIIRGGALSLKEQPYIEAARAIGAGHRQIVLRHMLPNLAPIIIITASVQIGGVILAESSLAFLGFGTPPPFPSWGAMLQDSQRFMRNYPYLAFFPGAAIALVVYAFNMLGDGLRDVLDPRMRGSR